MPNDAWQSVDGKDPSPFAWVLQEKVPRRERDRPYRAYSESGKLRLHRPVGAFHRREDRMDNLVIAFIAVAVAQVLQLLLTIVREREIKRLRKLVAEQSMFIKGWLMAERVYSRQPGITADRKPVASDTTAPDPTTTPKDLTDTIPPHTIEEETARVMNVINWLNEAQSVQPQQVKPDGDKPMPIVNVPAPAITPHHLHDRPRIT